jgi:hypothetical protein
MDGKPLGDPLDILLYQSTGWHACESADERTKQLVAGHSRTQLLVEPPSKAEASAEVVSQYAVVHRLDFTANRQRNSTVVVHPDDTVHVYTKVHGQSCCKCLAMKLQ